MDPLPQPNDNTDLLTAMLAGATAGAFQTVATYPFEYLKTSAQIQNSILMSKPPATTMSFRPMYTGCTALAIGNALKASTRMFLFNSFSDFMATENGTTTAPRVVVAGMMTGFVETLWVIPFENIKTRMIENNLYKEGMRMAVPKVVAESKLSSSPQLKTTKRPGNSPEAIFAVPKTKAISESRLKAIEYYSKHPSTKFSTIIKEIYHTQGLSGFKQGSLITIFRQCMNSMVWFSAYSSLQQVIDPNRDSISELELLGMGFASSCAVVATTQPIDLIKTRMQSKNYRLFYRDAMTCVFKVFMEEGLRKFWSGWFPRLVKVSCSSSVTLVTYEVTVKGIDKLKSMKPFAAS
ncbi:DEKNAAC101778 [Brettanomyces naardenensis]|uniref:DEKNAAC101778 n=1 Tax=Brettanomyces naardenensis TaxID=13370 RepID=A0A448YIU5_BRENA|nr:DEKNAAC101778 [Brettanomyces naardenensis]